MSGGDGRGFIGTRREVLIGAALLASAGIAFARRPREHQALLGSAKLDALVPTAFRGWQFETRSGFVLPPQDQLRDSLYSQLLTRAYTRGDDSVMLLIAYSGASDGVLQVHRPEVCYPAGGYRLLTNDVHRLALSPRVALPSRAILAQDATTAEQMIYWTRLGSHFPTSWRSQRLAVVDENLAGVVPDSVLVRISTRASGALVPMLDGFAADLFASIGPRMRSVLVGRT